MVADTLLNVVDGAISWRPVQSYMRRDKNARIFLPQAHHRSKTRSAKALGKYNQVVSVDRGFLGQIREQAVAGDLVLTAACGEL